MPALVSAPETFGHIYYTPPVGPGQVRLQEEQRGNNVQLA